MEKNVFVTLLRCSMMKCSGKERQYRILFDRYQLIYALNLRPGHANNCWGVVPMRYRLGNRVESIWALL